MKQEPKTEMETEGSNDDELDPQPIADGAEGEVVPSDDEENAEGSKVKSETNENPDQATPPNQKLATAPQRKRRGRPSVARISKKKIASLSDNLDQIDVGNVDSVSWETLLAQIRLKLRTMDSDEFFDKALQIQLLSRSEVENRSHHLARAMDLMSQQIPAPAYTHPPPSAKQG